MTRDARREVIEGALLAAQAQLRMAQQRAADAKRQGDAVDDAARLLVGLVAEAYARALPGAEDSVLGLVRAEARHRLLAGRADRATSRALDTLLDAVPDELRRALERLDLGRDGIPPETRPPAEGLEGKDECSTD